MVENQNIHGAILAIMESMRLQGISPGRLNQAPGSDRANHPNYRYKCPKYAYFQRLNRPFQAQNHCYKRLSAHGVR
jgi:hypothetical protein